MARLKHFNRHSTKPYELSFSLGYALFDRSQHRTPEDLLRHLDLLMYEHKRQIKAERRVEEQSKRSII
jgi:GGDEF domain-containing protein